MTQKSRMTLEQHQCPICGEIFDTGKVLTNTLLTDSLDQGPISGYSLCPEHLALWKDGYIALIEIIGPEDDTDRVDFDGAERTGHIAHIQLEIYNKLFGPTGNQYIEDDQFVFVQKGILEELKQFQQDK